MELKPIDDGENIKYVDNDEEAKIYFVEEPTYDPSNLKGKGPTIVGPIVIKD